jgi:hypothetical protein
MKKAKLLIVLIILNLALTSQAKVKAKYCYLPLNSTYYVSIGIDKLLTHSDLSCHEVNNAKLSSIIKKSLGRLRYCSDTTYQQNVGDYRIYLRCNYKNKIVELYIQKNGLIRYNNAVYYPDTALLKAVSQLISQPWTVNFPKEWGVQ